MLTPVKPIARIVCDGKTGGNFHWKRHDFTISLPPNCVEGCIELTICPSLPENFQVYSGTFIVSAVFDIHCNKKLVKPATLCLYHFVNLKSEDDVVKMNFCIDHETSYEINETSYEIKHGNFRVGSCYGVVEMLEFSKVSILLQSLTRGLSCNIWEYIWLSAENPQTIEATETLNNNHGELQNESAAVITQQPSTSASQEQSHQINSDYNDQLHPLQQQPQLQTQGESI